MPLPTLAEEINSGKVLPGHGSRGDSIPNTAQSEQLSHARDNNLSAKREGTTKRRGSVKEGRRGECLP